MLKFAKQHKSFLIQVGITTTILFLSPADALASALDDGGMGIYWRLVSIGKYVILGKGVVECIQSALNGDYDKAKHSFIGYLMVFGLMLALPTALNQIEGLFPK